MEFTRSRPVLSVAKYTPVLPVRVTVLYARPLEPPSVTVPLTVCTAALGLPLSVAGAIGLAVVLVGAVTAPAATAVALAQLTFPSTPGSPAPYVPEAFLSYANVKAVCVPAVGVAAGV